MVRVICNLCRCNAQSKAGAIASKTSRWLTQLIHKSACRTQATKVLGCLFQSSEFIGLGSHWGRALSLKRAESVRASVCTVKPLSGVWRAGCGAGVDCLHKHGDCGKHRVPLAVAQGVKVANSCCS